MTAKGFNYRLTDIQSALGNSQLKSLETFITKRRELVKRYDSKLKNKIYISSSEKIQRFEQSSFIRCQN